MERHRVNKGCINAARIITIKSIFFSVGFYVLY